MGRGGECGVHIAGLLTDAPGHVVGHVEVRDRRTAPGGLQVDRGGKRFVLDPDALGGVLGRVPVAGNDHGHHLARVADLVPGQGKLRPRVDEVVAGDEDRQPCGEVAIEVGVGEHAEQARDGSGLRRVDPGDAGVREVRPDERGVRRLGFEVGGVSSAAGKEPPVFPPLHRLPKQAGGHRGASRIRDAASCTAATMF